MVRGGNSKRNRRWRKHVVETEILWIDAASVKLGKTKADTSLLMERIAEAKGWRVLRNTKTGLVSAIAPPRNGSK